MEDQSTMHERVGVAHVLGMIVSVFGLVVSILVAIACAGVGLWFVVAGLLQLAGLRL